MSEETQSNKPLEFEEPVRARQRTPGFMRMVRLCRKELREIVRDRRTIVTLILMPLLAYPLLSMSFQRLVLSSGRPAGNITWIAGVEDQQTAERLQRLLAIGERINRRRNGESQTPPPAADDESAAEPEFRVKETNQLEQELTDGQIDLGVRIRQLRDDGTLPVDIQLILRDESSMGRSAAEFLEGRLEPLNRVFLRRQLGDEARLPVTFQTRNVERRESTVSLTAFVPLILILMTITGAVYPAIDLTAGERERGTLETLMAAPVPRFGLLFAKYVAVVTIAMLTAATNLIAMTVTLMVSGMGPLVFGPEGPTIQLMDQVFGLLILFAAFFSAILLAITSFARSFKEAQSYLIPVMLVTLAPGIMSLMPDLEFTATLAVTPLVNIVLLARDLLKGNVDVLLATAAVLSTIFYAVAAISLAARIFGTDAILYGSQATWTDLVRRPSRPRQFPSIAGSMICLACIYPFYFLMANSLQRLGSMPMSMRLLLTGGVTALLFVGLPLVAAIIQRTRLMTTFQLGWPSILSLLGAGCLGLSLWPFAHEVFMLNQFFGINLDLDQFESAQELLEEFKSISPLVILISLAVAPAVCEEFFFRGYLMGALRQSTPGYVAVVVSAILFGVFHVITTSVLAPERMLPSTFLGLVLGWICLRTNSILPGVLLHALHNGLLLMMGKYRDELMERGLGIDERSHMPLTWLAAATVAVVVGIVLVAVSTRRKDDKVKK